MAANPFDPRLFKPDAIAPETHAFNEGLAQRLKGQPKWWEQPADGSPAARPVPTAPKSPRARRMTAQMEGRPDVDLHVVAPDTPKGVYLHIHGGGWVVGDKKQDTAHYKPFLEKGISCAAINYRLTASNPLSGTCA